MGLLACLPIKNSYAGCCFQRVVELEDHMNSFIACDEKFEASLRTAVLGLDHAYKTVLEGYNE